MSVSKTFGAVNKNSNFVFRSGKIGLFSNGELTTNDPAEIEELEAACLSSHGLLFELESATQELRDLTPEEKQAANRAEAAAILAGKTATAAPAKK